eukprot:7347774-Pyramimonas_sp.AAC.1
MLGISKKVACQSALTCTSCWNCCVAHGGLDASIEGEVNHDVKVVKACCARTQPCPRNATRNSEVWPSCGQVH